MKKNLTLTERKRLDILAAAQNEFKEKGYLGASMDSLAKRAEVSKRTVYNHFSSKEILFLAIIKELCDSFIIAGKIEYTTERSLSEQLTQVAEKELALFSSDEFQDLNRIALVEFIRSPELAASTIEHIGEQEGGLNEWIKKAIQDKRLKTVDPDYAAHQFFGLIKATAFWPQLLLNQSFPNKEQQRIIIDDAVFMFLARYNNEEGS